MENRKEIDVLKRISDITGKPQNTLRDWKKHEKNYKVYEALENYVNILDSQLSNNLEQEIINTINKLPDNKKKKFYYLMMAELAELE